MSWDEIQGTLVSHIARWTANCNQYKSKIPELTLWRPESPTEPRIAETKPGICIIVQGTKRIHLGNKTTDCDIHSYMLSSINLPLSYQVLSASPEKPCLGLILDFDIQELSQLMIDSKLPSLSSWSVEQYIASGKITLPLLCAIQRLLGLLDDPRSIPFLASGLNREILYRLLVGEHGNKLRQAASAGSHNLQPAQAIEWSELN